MKITVTEHPNTAPQALNGGHSSTTLYTVAADDIGESVRAVRAQVTRFMAREVNGSYTVQHDIQIHVVADGIRDLEHVGDQQRANLAALAQVATQLARILDSRE